MPYTPPSDTLPQELESTTHIRFQDCDPFGHLNNAQYLDYFMNAREDHLLANYAFDIFAWTETEEKAFSKLPSPQNKISLSVKS